MDVEVRGLAGGLLCSLKVQGTETVAQLKELIHKDTQIKPNLQKLLLGVQLLRNSDVLGEFLAEGALNEVVLLQTDKWIEEVAQDWRRLRKASEAVRNDKELVLAAIDRSRGEAVKFAGDQIRADREVMLAAMAHDGSLYRYANPALGLDLDFMVVALREPPCRNDPLPSWQWHTHAGICADKIFMLLMVARNGVSLQHAASALKDDQELVRTAMTAYPMAFQYASENLKSNQAFARHAIAVTLNNLMHVSDVLLGDRQFLLDCLPIYPEAHAPVGGSVFLPSILKKLPENLRSDRAVVLRALRALPPTMRKDELRRASKELQADHELQDLTRSTWAARAYPAPALRIPEQPYLMSDEVRTTLQYAKSGAHERAGFWRSLVDKDPALLTMLGKDAGDERELVLAAVRKDGSMLAHASDELLLDVDVVMAALENDASVYDLLPEVMRCKGEVALLAFRKYQIKLPKALLSNRHIVVEAAASQEKTTDVEKRRLQKLPLAHLVAKFELA